MFQPDIAPNVGAAMRLCACLGVGLDLIEPCGFPLSDKALRRAALDYGPACAVVRHDGWGAYVQCSEREGGRIVCVETDADIPLHRFVFAPGDRLLLGRETAGTPREVRAACAAAVAIPMVPGARSLNVVTAGAMILAEALRQTAGWPIRAGH